MSAHQIDDDALRTGRQGVRAADDDCRGAGVDVIRQTGDRDTGRPLEGETGQCEAARAVVAGRQAAAAEDGQRACGPWPPKVAPPATETALEVPSVPLLSSNSFGNGRLAAVGVRAGKDLNSGAGLGQRNAPTLLRIVPENVPPASPPPMVRVPGEAARLSMVPAPKARRDRG